MRQALRTSSTSPHRHGSGRKYWSGRKVWHGGVRTSSCASTAVLSAGDSRKHTRRLQEPPTLEDSTSRSTPSSPAPAAARCALSCWSSCTRCLLEPFFSRDGRNILWVTVLGKFITLPGPTPIAGAKGFGSGQNSMTQASSELVQDVLSQSVTVGIRTGGRALVLLVCPCTKCW